MAWLTVVAMLLTPWLIDCDVLLTQLLTLLATLLKALFPTDEPPPELTIGVVAPPVLVLGAGVVIWTLFSP